VSTPFSTSHLPSASYPPHLHPRNSIPCSFPTWLHPVHSSSVSTPYRREPVKPRPTHLPLFLRIATRPVLQKDHLYKGSYCRLSADAQTVSRRSIHDQLSQADGYEGVDARSIGGPVHHHMAQTTPVSGTSRRAVSEDCHTIKPTGRPGCIEHSAEMWRPGIASCVSKGTLAAQPGRAFSAVTPSTIIRRNHPYIWKSGE
jgi:hypothetical protein